MTQTFEIRAGVLTGCHAPAPVLRLPEGVRVIGEGALRGMTGIREIFIPEGVEVIEGEAFLGCTDLVTVHFPDSLHQIHFGAFCGCTHLQPPQLPRNLRFIDRYAFQECVSIHSIAIPRCVEAIGFGAFRGCGLEQVEMEDRNFAHFYDVEVLFLHDRCPCCRRRLLHGRGGARYCRCDLSGRYNPYTMDSVRNWNECDEQYHPYFQYASSIGLYNPFPPEGEANILIRCLELDDSFRGEPFPYPARMEIGGSVTSIPEGLFGGWTELRELKLQNGLLEIGERAFAGCENLTSVWIPGTVRRIGENAFANCTRLTSVFFSPTGGPSVEEIGPGAFFGCKALKEIHVPDTVTNLGKDAFRRCPFLELAILPPALKDLDMTQVFGTDEEGELTTEIVITEERSDYDVRSNSGRTD